MDTRQSPVRRGQGGGRQAPCRCSVRSSTQYPEEAEERAAAATHAAGR